MARIQGGPPVKLFDSGVVASGGAIDSGIISTSGAIRLGVYFVNADAATRTVARTDFATDGVTTLGSVFSVAAAAAKTSTGDHGPAAVNLSTNVILSYSGPTPAFVQFTVAAAGSSNGQLIVYGYP